MVSPIVEVALTSWILTELMFLDSFASPFPSTLSGGVRSEVGIGLADLFAVLVYPDSRMGQQVGGYLPDGLEWIIFGEYHLLDESSMLVVGFILEIAVDDEMDMGRPVPTGLDVVVSWCIVLDGFPFIGQLVESLPSLRMEDVDPTVPAVLGGADEVVNAGFDVGLDSLLVVLLGLRQ